MDIEQIVNTLNFSSIAWQIITPICFSLADILTGFIQALINKNPDSQIMRAGLLHKILIILVIIVVIIFMFKSKSLNPESDDITKIYNYLGTNDLDICNGLYAYDENEVNYDTLDNKWRICNAYNNLNVGEETVIKIDKTKKDNNCRVGENITFATDNYNSDVCTISKVSSEEVNSEYKKIYGRDIENYETFDYNDTTICYYEDDYYYCGLKESYTTTIGAEPSTYRSIQKAVQNDDEIIIYDYFLKVVNNECLTSFTGNTKNDECSTDYNEDTKINYSYLKKYGTRYKHTFKKSGDDYYWVKSEPSS